MDKPKQKTPVEYWENAKEPFKEILDRLLPDIVIVTGYQTFENLPDECIQCKSITIKEISKELKVKKYVIKKKVVNICGMWHPATPGFRYADWRSLYKKFYKELKKMNNTWPR